MLIQVCTARADVPADGRGIASVRGAIGPAITDRSGNRGFLMATDRSAGRYVAAAAWSDDAAEQAQNVLAPGAVAGATRHLGAGAPTVEVFDLAVSHAVKPVRIGYWGRLTRIRVPAGQVDRAAERFLDTFVPGFEHDDGLAAVSMVLGRGTGDGYAVEWYDGLARLRDSRARERESALLMLAALPSLTAVETVELRAVIVEQPAIPGPGGADASR